MVRAEREKDRADGNLRPLLHPTALARRSKLAISVGGAEGNNLWVFDLVRNVKTRLTFSQSDLGPAWSPDGKTIAFQSGRASLFHLYEKAADGSGKTAPLVVDDATEFNPVWSADGRYLVFERQAASPGSLMEVWAEPTFGDRKPFRVVQSRFSVSEQALSADGKWLAYVSTESGNPELYVQPFPRGGGRWQVSNDGGSWPEWRRDGKDLYYVSANGMLMAAEISLRGSDLMVGKVAPLFQVNVQLGPDWPYDVTADGKKFVVANQRPGQASQPLTLVTNWPALLKKR